jgi:hypothetical protein
MEACLGRDLLQNSDDLDFAGPVWRPLLTSRRELLVAMSPALLRLVPAVQRRRWFADG